MDLDKLLKTGEVCIHSEPSACNASCPVHLDVIALVSAIEKGDFKKAYQTMEKRIPFVRLIGKICDHPCETQCVRQNAGGAIQISELEKAVLNLGDTTPKKTLALPKKKGDVAVVGGGISGLTVAYDLDKKGYKVTLFEGSTRLGGSFWDYEGHGLTTSDIEEEMNRFEKIGMEIKYTQAISVEELETLTDTYAAVYLGTGVWPETYTIHKETFQVEGKPIFVGGGLFTQSSSVINAVATGRRAAISIDRYIAGTSLIASREREGIFETPLVQNLKGVLPAQPQVKVGDVFTEEEAKREAERCLKCQCVECYKACSHLQTFDIFPDDYTRRINHNERIILGTHFANKMINSCTECGLCKVECPVDIDMGAVIHETRESMVERKKMPVSAHDFALKDMRFSNSDYFSLIRKQPSKEQSKSLFYYPVIAFSKYARGLYKGSGKTGYVFYPGCQLSATHADHIEDIYRHLVGSIKEADADRDVGLYLGCCGAPADWAGRKDLMHESTDQIKATWEEMEHPTFILACSSCMQTFEKYLPEIETVSLWEIFDKYGLPEVNVRAGKREISIHDACATRAHGEIHESVRNIVKTLGYKIEEMPYSKEETKCCGYGGLVSYANPEQASAFVKDRINDSGEKDVLVYCAMCKDALVKEGKKAYHILDVIYGDRSEENGGQKMPTLSERQNNRMNVKRQLLKNVWGEEVDMDLIQTYDFELQISEEVSKLMEKRFILLSDVQKVVDHSRKTGERFFNPENGRYLARLRLDHVTFWVQYTESDAVIFVNSVYSHRMEIVEEPV
jgi:Fe-S oxidoreductase